MFRELAQSRSEFEKRFSPETKVGPRFLVLCYTGPHHQTKHFMMKKNYRAQTHNHKSAPVFVNQTTHKDPT